MSEEMMGRLLPESIGPGAHLEKAALRETQHGASGADVLVRGYCLTAAALVFACLPEESALIVSALRKGGVWLAGAFCAVSLGLWYRFFQNCMKLRALGLHKRPRKLWLTWSWEMAGSVVGLPSLRPYARRSVGSSEMWDCPCCWVLVWRRGWGGG